MLNEISNVHIDINKLMLNNNVDCIKINKQIIGSCTFTNVINYLVYMIHDFSNFNTGDSLATFTAWYNKAKKYMKVYLLEKTLADFQSYDIEDKINNYHDVFYIVNHFLNNQNYFDDNNILEKNKSVIHNFLIFGKTILFSKISNFQYKILPNASEKDFVSLHENIMQLVSDEHDYSGKYKNIIIKDDSIIVKFLENLIDMKNLDEMSDNFYNVVFNQNITYMQVVVVYIGFMQYVNCMKNLETIIVSNFPMNIIVHAFL